jgi:hypothetical protein
MLMFQQQHRDGLLAFLAGTSLRHPGCQESYRWIDLREMSLRFEQILAKVHAQRDADGLTAG